MVPKNVCFGSNCTCSAFPSARFAGAFLPLNAAIVHEPSACTCDDDVPSWLCQVHMCWALEVGMCEGDTRGLAHYLQDHYYEAIGDIDDSVVMPHAHSEYPHKTDRPSAKGLKKLRRSLEHEYTLREVLWNISIS